MSLLNPGMTDGLGATIAPLIECYNLTGDGTTYQRYEYLGDGIAVDGVDVEHTDGDGNPLGGDARAGFEKGSVSLKCVKASYKIPKPGHIIHADFGDGDEFYRVTQQGRTRTRNGVKTASVQVTRLVNPFPLECLTEAFGQRNTKSQAAGALSGSFASALTAKNTRSGGTVAWTIQAMPGFTLPGWLSCNSSTGALSGTAVAGSWDIMIIATETLTGQPTRAGFGILSLTIT